MNRFARRMARAAAALERAGTRAALASALQGAQILRDTVPVDSGALRSSVHVRQEGTTASVSAGAPHAAMVEYGTSRMPPRPFMLPMAAGMRGEFVEKARAAVQEVFR